jgi:hypothetical protein
MPLNQKHSSKKNGSKFYKLLLRKISSFATHCFMHFRKTYGKSGVDQLHSEWNGFRFFNG